jgi:hypothetical protein
VIDMADIAMGIGAGYFAGMLVTLFVIGVCMAIRSGEDDGQDK